MKTVGILTLGCRVNQYESGAVGESLTALGYKLLPFNGKCDCYIINSCAVTEESVRKSRQAVRRAYKNNPDAFILVMGCASQLEKDAFLNIDGVKYVYGVRNKGRVVKIIDDYFNGAQILPDGVNASEGTLDSSFISHFDRTRAYVKIQDGCNNKCAYCIIPKLRGKIVLRNKDEIVKEVKALALGGCHEVVLTGIETAAYGKGLSTLIKEISDIEGIDRIRMGSLDPAFVKAEFIDSIAGIKQVCRHFHISVQNGSNNVLKAMRRRYNTEMIEKNVEYIRSVMPDVNFSADIIVGFPGETEEDFNNTCKFVKAVKFLHLHIFTYSSRPNTEAAEMEGQIPESIKTQRLHILSKIADECKTEILSKIISRKEPVKILAENVKNGLIMGHTDNFIECAVESRDCCQKNLKGKVISAYPIKISDGRLYCKFE